VTIIATDGNDVEPYEVQSLIIMAGNINNSFQTDNSS
jgi:hypothetical protein